MNHIQYTKVCYNPFFELIKKSWLFTVDINNSGNAMNKQTGSLHRYIKKASSTLE